jgi:LuxR family transcriptional regulator, maltose regulon positive regulatory protein
VWRSKTAVPALRQDHVSRPALLDLLDRGEGRALTLVSAPPGYGKSLLLADWIRSGDVASAWVSLDEQDDDPQRLWTSVLAALAACPAVVDTSPLARLAVPRTGVGVDFTMDVISALADLTEPVRLVLDDAHHLRSDETVHGLQLLVRHRPRTLRLVLAGRLDPVLPIARLRMEEQLCELRIAQLAFSVDETATLARRCGLQLTDAQTGVLRERTAGWVAGIRLAAMPLRDHPDADRFLADFSGDHRPVADYLADEVLAHLSPAERDLLRRTSIAAPIPVALAAELSGRADAADVLADLERRWGLVSAVGDGRAEYRMHELTRSYLSADLARQGPGVAAELHGRAASWWAAQGRPVTALLHAAQAADPALVAGLLHRWAPELVARGEHQALARALAVLEGSGGAPDAWLPLVSAQIHLARGERDLARTEVARASGMRTDPDDAALAHFRSATEWLARTATPPASSGALPTDPALAGLVSAARANSSIFAPEASTAAVLADLETALALARDEHFGFLEVQSLCLIGTAAAASDYARASSAASAAIAAATRHGWQDSWWAAVAHAALALGCLMQADPARALETADAGLLIPAVQRDSGVRFSLRCARGGALFDLGDRAVGLHELQEAHAELGGDRPPLHRRAMAALLEHRAALLLNSPAAAATSAGRLGEEHEAPAERALVRAWTEAAGGSADRARAAVGPVLDGSLRPVQTTTVVEAWLVEVWGALRSGDRPTARRALQTALALAEERDVVRPFAFAGQGLRVLLVDQLGGSRDPAAFAFRCLSARQRAVRVSSVQLSTREQDVLTQLVSLSNLGEIADDMSVSVNTIKSHVRSIYGKLGVSTRRTAVLTALEQGLLS